MKVKKQGWINIARLPFIGLNSYGIYESEEEAITYSNMLPGEILATIQIEWEEEV